MKKSILFSAALILCATLWAQVPQGISHQAEPNPGSTHSIMDNSDPGNFNQQPLEHLLNPDGTLNLSSGFSGSLDPTGFRMVNGQDGGPRFVKEDAGYLDQNFYSNDFKRADGDENWHQFPFFYKGINDVAHTVAVSGTDLYVGGNFSQAGGISTNRIGKWDIQTETWSTMESGIEGSVRTIAISGNDVYVGGTFTSAGGISSNRIAKWNVSTETWSSLGIGVNNTISSIVIVESDIYIGGSFTQAGGQNANRIAKWNTNTETWSSLGSGVNGTVNAIAISGSYIYIGGTFTQAGGISANRIAKWDTTAETWSPLGDGVSNEVFAIALSGNDVYVGGSFTQAGGINTNNIAKWDGSTWSALGSGVNHIVHTIAVSGNDIYLGGSFTSVGDVSVNRIVKWDGNSWFPLGTGVNGTVRSITLSENKVYVAGFFTRAGGASAHRIAKWDGTVWSYLETGEISIGLDSWTRAIAVSGSDVYVGGEFTQAGEVYTNRIAKWDGTSWAALGNGVNSDVEAITISGNNIYIAGGFTQAGGISANSIAKWNTTTETWSNLGSGVSGGGVYVISVSGSDVYVGGSFTQAGGISANRIAKWDGNSWSALGSGLNRTVYTIAISDSDIYVGGSFTYAGNISTNRIARWSTITETWSALGNGVSGTQFPYITSIVLSDSFIYVGGMFTIAGSSTANYIAKWNGEVWEPLGSGLNASVSDIVVMGNDLYPVGLFTLAGGIEAKHIAKWNGSSWSSLGSGVCGGNIIQRPSAIASSNDGLFVVGEFTYAGGKLSNNIAFWQKPLSDENFHLTLNLDMSLTPGFNPETDLVYVTGTFTDFWPEPGTDPENQLMSRVGETMLYTITLLLEPGEYEYKYFINAGWEGGEWEAGENRQLTLADDMVVDDFWGYLEFPDAIDVPTLAELRAMPPGETIYRYTGEAVIVAMPGQSLAAEPYVYSDFEEIQNVTFDGWPNWPEIVLNPDPSGVNTSSLVAEWFRTTEPIAHVYAELDGKIDFSEQHIFRVKIWSPIPCEVLFKLEDKTDYNISTEVSQYVSDTEQWVELTYDFSGAASGMYDKIVIFMDYLSSENNIFYFDDVTGPAYEGVAKSGSLAFKSGTTDKGLNRNRKFIQDETAAIFIFDSPGNISTSYNLYDVITNVTGQIEVLNNMVRFLPTGNAPEALGNTPVEPYLFAMDEVTPNDQAKLIKFNNVAFEGIEAGETFIGGQNYTITDGASSFVLRTHFWEEDYIGQEIPHVNVDLTGVVTQFNDAMQITPRFAADIEEYFEPVMYNLTLNVDMSEALNFDPNIDLVYVTGTFAGFWPIPGTDPDNQLMIRVDETMIWTKTFYLEEGDYEYKYFLNEGWDGGEWSGDPNRIINLENDMIVDDTWSVHETDEIMSFILPLPGQTYEVGVDDIIPVQIQVNEDYQGYYYLYIIVDGHWNSFSESYFESSGVFNHEYFLPDAMFPGEYNFLLEYYIYDMEEHGYLLSNSFNIINNNPGIDVIRPYSWETLIAGEFMDIRWNSVNVSDVNIFYSINNGVTWELIVSGVSSEDEYWYWGHNTYYWQVPDDIEGIYNQSIIRIEVADNPAVFAHSETFTIMSSPIVFNAPLPDQQYIVGEDETIPIEIELTGDYNVDYQLYLIGGAWDNILSYSFSGPAIHNYDYVIPQTFATGTYYFRLDFYFSEPDVIGLINSNSFTVENNLTGIDVPMPEPGLVWIPGNSYEIRWNSVNISEVNIYYSLNNGTTWNVIEESIPSYNGYYTWGHNHFYWEVPGNISGAYDQCLIRIENANNTDIYGLSEWFTIASSIVTIIEPNAETSVAPGVGLPITLNVFQTSWLDINLVDEDNNWSWIGQFYAETGQFSYTWFDIHAFIPGYYRIHVHHHDSDTQLLSEYFEVLPAGTYFNVTFNIDMSLADDFDADNDLVYLSLSSSGSLPEPGSDPENQTMSRIEETMIWTKLLDLDAGEYEYKYFINSGWDGGEWSGLPNRQLTISGDTVLNDLWNRFRVHVAAHPEEGGSATGDGNYRYGMEAFVNAWPAEGYKFIYWTKGEEIVSIQEIYNFLMPAEDISLIAHFELDDDPCLPPDWVPVTGMQYSMQVAAHLYLYDEISFNPNDILGAFVDGECRGVASPDPDQDGLVFLTISSNVISGETVELVIWDSENCEPCQTWQTLIFENLEQIGDPGNPYIATCQGFVEFSAAMGEGFTWFSMNVDPGSMFLSTMMGSLAPCNNDRVIGQTIYAIFHEGNWMGSLKEIDPIRSYKMHLCSNQELYLLGAPILSAPMNISNGFTWMGYTPQVCIPINTAMSNISPEPENNDRVIAQTTYAIYNNGQWMGSLKDLCPGKGYVFSLTHNTTLQYPENAGKGEMLAYAEDLKDKTGPVAENMQYTMTVLGQLINTDGNISLNANDIIYAVSGNEKRGSAWPDIQNDGLLFMNIASNNQANELINFIAWSDDLQQYVGISETINFESLRATGSLQSPFIFTMTDPLGTEIFGFTHNTIGEPYPNPTFGLVNFPYYLTEPSQVNLYIYNSMGQPVYISELNKEIPGSHTIVFEKEKLPRGIYLYKVVLYGKKDFIVKNGVLVVVE